MVTYYIPILRLSPLIYRYFPSLPRLQTILILTLFQHDMARAASNVSPLCSEGFKGRLRFSRRVHWRPFNSPYNINSMLGSYRRLSSAAQSGVYCTIMVGSLSIGTSSFTSFGLRFEQRIVREMGIEPSSTPFFKVSSY